MDRRLRKTMTTGANTSSVFDLKKGTSIYQKILLNYLQMIAIVQSMDLRWPFYLRGYLGIYSNIGGASGQALSFDCLLYNANIDVESLYAQTIVVNLFPLILIFIAVLVLIVIFFINKKKRNQFVRFLSIVIIISVFFQSSIIQKLFQNLSCKQIDNKKYLAISMNLECNNDSNKEWVNKICIN